MNNDDEIKFNRVYEKYSVMLYRVSFLYTGSRDDSEDILQDVFIKYLYKSPPFKDEVHEKAWLIRTTKNLCLDFKKSKKNNSISLDAAALQSIDFGIDDSYLDVRQKLLQLDDKYKIVIYLYYYEDYSVSMIASSLKITSSNVKSRLKRARDILKIELED
ncbi:MAG: RNA polymerase sigma factor [Acetobacter sp.]|nr:RNA polymerase sigma factor [Bacteroides sp.]MCM1341276.1 RNA polymerase sigma factor [Acetobacter sp.]MCM1433948.1 RNA polymerase sigma factor [Clostridiales bacterium]